MAPNALIHEKSPYLRQHADNPVDWHPWGEAAFTLARREGKPIFLSVGYAACHWCHVMAHESFEDPEAARLLNDAFVCVKVDREERPDIDTVYMTACQMLTGSGGWPLSIFMTPDKKPFFAGTYIPKESRFGQPGLMDLSRQIQSLWKTAAPSLEEAGEKLLAHMKEVFRHKASDAPEATLLDEAAEALEASFDPEHGGFLPAPKFPMPHRLGFLLQTHRRTGHERGLTMVEETLAAMRLGGIFDQVGFGFHRYSVDPRWHVPHFEKMLYDQALLADIYLDTFQATGNLFYAQAARDIFTYVLRDMTAQSGGFFSAEDADSEGEEGRFYLWTAEEFRKALGETETPWEKIFGIQDKGNFKEESTGKPDGRNILHLTAPFSDQARDLGVSEEVLAARWEEIRNRLFHIREKRPRPLKDDKILADWNGLMIGALAKGAKVLGEKAYEMAARRGAGFVLDTMRDETGRLYHRFRDGERAVHGMAEDYAFMIHGFLALHEATGDAPFAREALDLQNIMIDDFWDPEDGGFFSTSREGDLPVRPKEIYDGAIPSANSVSLENLLDLYALTGEEHLKERARHLIRTFAGAVGAHPTGFARFLCGLETARRQGII